ncbi:hypothetical protein BDZ91DRAFT_712644 [Kalaharituber pfeilii]|nr:hypothetical protein BDZ91DRAFT_712644 [Kalaharituber pfeilii]
MIKVEELEAHGKAAYKRKDYAGALQAFSTAIKSLSCNPAQTQKLISLYNFRAATYEKIEGKFEDALRDAKRMIELDGRVADGYLRAGKVLHLMGKSERALRVYLRGLQNVGGGEDHKEITDGKIREKVEKDREDLEKMCKKMEQIISGAKSEESQRKRDPLAVLPLELITMVFLHLEFLDLTRCQRVSRSWRQFFRKQYPYTYRTLDLSPCLHKPKFKLLRTLKHYIQSSLIPGHAPVTTLIFPATDAQLSELAHVLPSLQYLRVLGDAVVTKALFDVAKSAKGIKSIILECQTEISVVAPLIEACKALGTLECHSISGSAAAVDPGGGGWMKMWYEVKNESLENLLLNAQDDIGTSFGDDESKWDLTCFPRLTTFAATHVYYPEYPSLPPSIVHLTLNRNYHSPRSVMTTAHEILSSHPLPNLTSLDLSSNPRVTNDHVLLFLNPANYPDPTNPPLRSLNLSNSPYINCSSLSWLLGPQTPNTKTTTHNSSTTASDISQGTYASPCTHLTTLLLSQCPTFNDHLSLELHALSHLQFLDISLTKISGVGLVNIVKTTGRLREEVLSGKRQVGLEKVKIVGCDFVGRDAVEVVVGLGCEVEYLEGSGQGRKGGKGKGKKVRDPWMF